MIPVRNADRRSGLDGEPLIGPGYLRSRRWASAAPSEHPSVPEPHRADNVLTGHHPYAGYGRSMALRTPAAAKNPRWSIKGEFWHFCLERIQDRRRTLGEQRRAEIARALAADPGSPLDEPAAGVNPPRSAG
jgi:hypothetical protein